MAMSLWSHFFEHPVVYLKLRPYGAIQICLLLLYYYYRPISYSYCAVSIPAARDKRDAFACRPIATDFRSLQLYLEILTSLSLSRYLVIVIV